CAIIVAISTPLRCFSFRVKAISWIFLLSEAVFSGGRVLFFFISVAAVYILLLRRHCEQNYSAGAQPRRIFVRPSVIVFVVIIFTMLSAAMRLSPNPTMTSSYYHLPTVWVYHNATDWAYKLTTDLDSPLLMTLLAQTSYFSSPIPKLTYFVEVGGVDDWYQMGMYNFPQVSRLIKIVTGRNPWLDIRRQISKLVQSGHSPNPWATGVRDFVIDFGFFGAILACGVFGSFAQHIFQWALCSRCSERWVVSALVSISCAIFAFQSPFLIGYVSNTLYFVFILVVLRRIFFR
ncbi:MAG: hypothetical protein V1685_01525, partial [Parcubacteria group bacterium]